MEGDQGLVTRSRLTADDLAQLGQLAADCGRAESCDLSFVSAMAADYSGTLPQPLCFEDGTLIGGVGLQGQDAALEAALLVHPAHRRRGFGRALLAAVTTACTKRGIGGVLLVGTECSPSGRHFAAAIGAEYRFSEYRMALVAAPAPSPPSIDHLQVRPVVADEFPAFARVSAAVFGRAEELQRRAFANDLERTDRRLYLAWLGDTPVGTGRTMRGESEAFITTLGVLPNHRRRGFGRQILLRLIADLEEHAGHTISIEVATDNSRALALYRGCGFRDTSAFTYSYLDIAPTPQHAG